MAIHASSQDDLHIVSSSSHQVAVPAARFTTEKLTDIYNKTRVDYIVPMPMNTRRMEEYIHHYDVDTAASVVAMVEGHYTGIAMLGLRDQRAWITRLGVIPHERGKKTGAFLMENLIQQARAHQKTLIQLEVIKGNEPAYHLFTKFGFKPRRDLLVIVRPPRASESTPTLPGVEITLLDEAEIQACLEGRPDGASWIDETSSILKLGRLRGYRLTMPDGASGWIVFHTEMFQMSHFVFDATPDAYDDILSALLTHVHVSHPGIDSKFENLPVDHRAWALFQKVGYVESFRRIEMTLPL